MTFLNEQNELRTNFYAQLTHNSLRTNYVSNTKIILRRIKSVYDSSTQIFNEPAGTTDMAIGDPTAEIMITTLGKIPNEMYYLEDTTPSGKAIVYNTELRTILDNSHITMASIETAKSNGYTERSTLLIILLTILFIILFICCITACIIARSKNRHSFFTKSDIECSPECSINQPLLSLHKTSDTTTKISDS